MRRVVLLLAPFGLAACAAAGPTTQAKPTKDSTPLATAGMPTERPTELRRATATNAAATGPRVTFAPSPLSDLARALTTLAVTVLDGEPPPAGPIAIERMRDEKKLVRSEVQLPRGSDLEFFLFGIQMYAIFDEGPDPNVVAGSPGPPPPAQDGAVRITAMVGSTGYRVVDLAVRSGRRSQRLPGWLMGSLQASNDTVGALRSGRIHGLLFGESDRAVFRSDGLFERTLNEQPKPEVVRACEPPSRRRRGAASSHAGASSTTEALSSSGTGWRAGHVDFVAVAVDEVAAQDDRVGGGLESHAG
ncbi:MAG: hypothetical protein U0263_01425 [Polyangiaceae bacterium]